jgi:hypothetical protein
VRNRQAAGLTIPNRRNIPGLGINSGRCPLASAIADLVHPSSLIARSAPRAVDRRQVDHLLGQLEHIAAQLRSAGMSSRQIASALRRLAEGARS